MAVGLHHLGRVERRTVPDDGIGDGPEGDERVVRDPGVRDDRDHGENDGHVTEEALDRAPFGPVPRTRHAERS
jgi:hypothetical protein